MVDAFMDAGDLGADCPVRGGVGDSLPISSVESDFNLRTEEDKVRPACETVPAAVLGRVGDRDRGALPSNSAGAVTLPRGVEDFLALDSFGDSLADTETGSDGDLCFEFVGGLSVRQEDRTSDLIEAADCDAGDVHWDRPRSESGCAESSPFGLCLGDRTAGFAWCGDTTS